MAGDLIFMKLYDDRFHRMDVMLAFALFKCLRAFVGKF